MYIMYVWSVCITYTCSIVVHVKYVLCTCVVCLCGEYRCGKHGACGGHRQVCVCCVSVVVGGAFAVCEWF